VRPNKTEDGIVLQGLEIKYPTLQNFFYTQTDTLVTREEVISVTSAVVPVEDEAVAETPEEPPKRTIDLGRIDLSELDSTKLVRIRYPDTTGLFVQTLRQTLAGDSCRIFHYGDSQIEGDRITAYLRNRLQGIYGGSGPGFITVKQVYEQISARVAPSENWVRYASFDPGQERLKHNKYGTYLSLSRFSPVLDSLPAQAALDSLPLQQATIAVSASTLYYKRMQKFSTIGLHYGNSLVPVAVKVEENGTIILQDSLVADGRYHYLPIRLTQPPTDIRITFTGKISPDVYGLTLDGDGGIQIDNIAMRGSSGTVFTRLDAVNYAAMARVLKPRLVLMQYGGNTVPYLRDSTGVDNYVSYMKQHINWVKARTNNAQVLYIGPADMVTMVNGQMTTYDLLPYLNKRLAETCLDADVAYWDMFEAMGGKGAMPIWVEQGLAGNDYTHFTPKGSKIISELFFVALYLDLINDNYAR
jgi:lysophospholipase L1-like esterase